MLYSSNRSSTLHPWEEREVTADEVHESKKRWEVLKSVLFDIILPSTLSGNYQIELVVGYWLFKGWIYL